MKTSGKHINLKTTLLEMFFRKIPKSFKTNFTEQKDTQSIKYSEYSLQLC